MVEQPATKRKIDQSGKILADNATNDEILYILSEDILDNYRKSHLEPLTQITMTIQNSLSGYEGEYYISQRLKRKPQIIRKLRRFSVRLTQLQDIGGCRVIVSKSENVDDIECIISDASKENFKIVRRTDYREGGRDDTGYRALHLILEKNDRRVEVQVRSNIQHYWSENIERTSVVYGHYLKEGDGDDIVIDYFKYLSDVLHLIERGYRISVDKKAELERRRSEAVNIIKSSDKAGIIDTKTNDGFIKALISKSDKNRGSLSNWIIVFDWNSGQFVTWDSVSRNPDEAMSLYKSYEEQYPESKKYEVVLIGSSSIETIQKTHSHYFGVKSPENILMTLEQEVSELEYKGSIDISGRQILETMYRRRHWGGETYRKRDIKESLL